MSIQIQEGICIKRCTKCGEEKPATTNYYYRQSGTKDGLAYWCKECRACYNMALRATEERSPRRKADVPIGYKRCSRCGDVKAATADHFNRDSRRPSGLRSWCKLCTRKCANEYKESGRRKYTNSARNRTTTERDREYQRLYRQSHRKEHADATRRWKAANPEKVKSKNDRRKELLANARGTHSADDILAQFKRQKGKCFWCEVKLHRNYHVDHIVPLSRGGSNGPENIVIACPSCNTSKSNKLPHEWAQSGRLI